MLHLFGNPDMSDAGAAKLLGCLGYVKELWLHACIVSDGMERKLIERGWEVGCGVHV